MAHEGTNKSPKKGLIISLVILTGSAIFLGILGTVGEEFTAFSGILLGGIVFISGLVPVLYILCANGLALVGDLLRNWRSWWAMPTG